MTVADLMEKLSKHPRELRVAISMYGTFSDRVKIYEEDGLLYIEHDDVFECDLD